MFFDADFDHYKNYIAHLIGQIYERTPTNVVITPLKHPFGLGTASRIVLLIDRIVP